MMINLHSTMYLLKPTRQTHKRYKRTFTFHYVSIKTKKIHICIIGVRKFTFHYVSIKTAMETFQGTPQANLHSTMYLLKP